MGNLGVVMIGVSAFAFCGVIAGYLFHRILGGYIDGSISGLHCLVIGGLFIGLLICIIMSPTSPSLGVVAVLILLVFIIVPIVTSRAEKLETKHYYDEKIEAYRTAIETDPRNLAAREKLFEAYYKKGMLNEAVEVCSQLQRLAPTDGQIAYRLRLLKEELAEKIIPPKICPGCGHRNPAGRTTCEQCESSMSVATEFRSWLMSGGLKQVTWSSALALGVVAVFGCVLSILAVPGKIVFVTLLLLIVISAEYLYITRHW